MSTQIVGVQVKVYAVVLEVVAADVVEAEPGTSLERDVEQEVVPQELPVAAAEEL